MGWLNWALPILVLVMLIALRRLSVVGAARAKALLAEGARVIDVRTPDEFADGHVAGALNISLNELSAAIHREVPSTGTPLLVHCLSGGRSALAVRILRQRGYKAYNLGSLRRARRIVEG